ncbi:MULTISPECIES: hypothetical protein [unclassified Streptomyces]|uniref:hypothetical protein n=1 Tax=Streptomyces TaxID=1883 RepID=UPI000CD51D21|nr:MULTISPECIES: hypothetical protein [unclassified Streptomyces]AWL38177.1 hypothetical protein B9S64_08630 [Streptomyces sp. SM18]
MTVAVSGFMSVASGCGLLGQEAGAAKPSRVPPAPFTGETVAGEISAYTTAAGLPEGDTSLDGLPEGGWRACVVPWSGQVPEDVAAAGFEGTEERLRSHDWEIVSSHAEGEAVFRTFAKRGWKLYARSWALLGPDRTRSVTFTGVEDGCEVPGEVRDEYTDPAAP